MLYFLTRVRVVLQETTGMKSEFPLVFQLHLVIICVLLYYSTK